MGECSTLSGAPANNAVYTSLIRPGDTILGMDLLHGGHLTHGSPVNRSGMFNKAAHYGQPQTECLDYDQIADIAREVKPKNYHRGLFFLPWVPDWEKFKEIADSVGAYLWRMCRISPD